MLLYEKAKEVEAGLILQWGFRWEDIARGDKPRPCVVVCVHNGHAILAPLSTRMSRDDRVRTLAQRGEESFPVKWEDSEGVAHLDGLDTTFFNRVPVGRLRSCREWGRLKRRQHNYLLGQTLGCLVRDEVDTFEGLQWRPGRAGSGGEFVSCRLEKHLGSGKIRVVTDERQRVARPMEGAYAR